MGSHVEFAKVEVIFIILKLILIFFVVDSHDLPRLKLFDLFELIILV